MANTRGKLTRHIASRGGERRFGLRLVRPHRDSVHQVLVHRERWPCNKGPTVLEGTADEPSVAPDTRCQQSFSLSSCSSELRAARSGIASPPTYRHRSPKASTSGACLPTPSR
jgi:hypothetical protein